MDLSIGEDWSLTISVSLLLTDVGILIGQDTIMCEILNPLRKKQLFQTSYGWAFRLDENIGSVSV